jgi:hypothetical protein
VSITCFFNVENLRLRRLRAFPRGPHISQTPY